MRKIVWAVVVAGVFLAGAMVTAQETSSKNPTSPPQVMEPMKGMMGEGGAMGSMDYMRARMEMMHAMGGEETAKMMEHCQQMMGGAPAAEPEKSR